MKWLKKIEDFTDHVFSNKERAANRHLNQFTNEKPRETFDRACLHIANELINEGFHYLPNQRKIKKDSTNKDYSLYVKFNTVNENVAGQYVELSSIFYLDSKELKQFSKKKPLINYWSETVIVGDFGYLIAPKKGSLVWNIANKEEFENAVSIIANTVKEKLIHVFDSFQNTEYVSGLIEEGTYELTTTMSTVQYLLMLEKRAIAEKYLSCFLTRKPEKILSDYRNAMLKLEKEGTPNEFVHGLGYGYEIALLQKVYGLKIVVPN